MPAKTAYVIQMTTAHETKFGRKLDTAIVGYADDRAGAEAHIAYLKRTPPPLIPADELRDYTFTFGVLEVPHVAPPPVMVECAYSCPECHPERVDVPVETVGAGEGFYAWVQNVLLPTLIADHEKRSPSCRAKGLRLFVPDATAKAA